MAETFYLFYCMYSTYMLFYFSFFLAIIVCVAILEDDECNEQKKFGIATILMTVFLGFFICLLNTIKLKLFLPIWFIINLSFFIAWGVVRARETCNQPLDRLLVIFFITNIIFCGIALTFMIFWCCWVQIKECCKTPSRIQPSAPKRKKWVYEWVPVWVLEEV